MGKYADSGIKVVNNVREDDGINHPVYDHYTVVNSHNKIYNDVRIERALYKLKVLDGHLLRFICRNIDNRNQFVNDWEFRKRFIDHSISFSDGELVYTDGSVKNSISLLKREELIYPIDNCRGRYTVDPEYAVKNSDKYRLKMIKEKYAKRYESKL
jgi:hypothetical protein